MGKMYMKNYMNLMDLPQYGQNLNLLISASSMMDTPFLHPVSKMQSDER